MCKEKRMIEVNEAVDEKFTVSHLADIYSKDRSDSKNIFRCKIAKKGYYWDDKANSINYNSDLSTSKNRRVRMPFPYLLEKPDKEKSYKYKDPSKGERYLFWKFANLIYSKQRVKSGKGRERILKFANKYGSLVNGKSIVYTKKYSYNYKKTDKINAMKYEKGQLIPIGDTVYVPTLGEYYEFWTMKIAEMRAIILLWEAIEKKDNEMLNKIIKWEENKIHFTLSPDFKALEKDDGVDNSFNGIIAGEDEYNGKIDWDKFKSFNKGDVIEPARFLLDKLFQVILKDYLFDLESDNYSKINFVNGDIKLTPHNLLSYMWYEFYSLAKEDKQIGWCELCGGPEDVTNKRSDWKTHSICNKHRYQKKYRDLNAYEEGRKSKEDVVESWKDNRWGLEVTMEDVEQWIEDRKKNN